MVGSLSGKTTFQNKVQEKLHSMAKLAVAVSSNFTRLSVNITFKLNRQGIIIVNICSVAAFYHIPITMFEVMSEAHNNPSGG